MVQQSITSCHSFIVSCSLHRLGIRALAHPPEQLSSHGREVQSGHRRPTPRPTSVRTAAIVLVDSQSLTCAHGGSDQRPDRDEARRQADFDGPRSAGPSWRLPGHEQHQCRRRSRRLSAAGCPLFHASSHRHRPCPRQPYHDHRAAPQGGLPPGTRPSAGLLRQRKGHLVPCRRGRICAPPTKTASGSGSPSPSPSC